jgi:hypothetical protein
MMRFSKFAPIRYFAWLTLPALIILPGFMACSTSYHEHHKDWIGVFMFDSVTAGAVLLEYEESSPKGNTFGNGDQYNVDVDLFRYDFAKQILTKDRSLFKNMKDAGMYRVTEYNPPHLLQGASYAEGTALFDLETGEKRTLGIRVSHLSQMKGFFSNEVAIIDSKNLDTIQYQPNYLDPAIYLYSEVYNKYISLKAEKTNEQWVDRILLSTIGGRGDIELSGLPHFYYSDDVFVNWSENTAPIYPVDSDSAAVACNIDSLLIGRVFCDTFPRTSTPLNRLTGSFKSHHFIGIRDDGLYECSGKDTCVASQISNGGTSEK